LKRHFSAMRGIAILLVVLNHTIALGISYPAKAGIVPVSGIGRQILTGLELLGWFAVPIFLFISGSFFAYAAQGNRSRLSYKVVFENLKHILWPYIFWSIIFYIWLYIGHNEQTTVTGHIKNLIVGYPFHFVPLLIFFYLAAPILVWVLQRVGWLTVLILLSGYQVVLINIVDPGTFGFVFPAWMDLFAPPILSRTMADWGIYFPLGLVYTLNMAKMDPWVTRAKTAMLILTSGIFIVTVLAANQILDAAWARHIYPLSFVLYLPNLKRQQIPSVRLFEAIGKKAYGLYLTHLTLMDILLTIVLIWITPLLEHLIVLLPVLFFLSVSIPLLLMSAVGRLPSRNLYRLIFG
jgi:peptidoglycan/LPS O-acetylase OafA/YrhL